MGFFSRYVSERFLYPPPLVDRNAFVQCVLSKAGLTSMPVLYVFSDSTLLPLVSITRQQAPWKWLLPPSLDCFEVAFDKASTLQLACKLGIEAPATYSGTTGEGLPAFVKSHGWPLVVKSRRSVYWRRNGGIHVSASFATSLEELEAKCALSVSQTGEFPLVQEYVQGEEASVQFLCDRGTVLAGCANRRLRSVNPAGGAGALKQTVPLSYYGLVERARSLASALTWSGPMMVEFKIDQEVSEPKLMEINGRFWGSLPLAVIAGVDFPYSYYRLAQGWEIDPDNGYIPGVVTRHFMGDLRHLYAVLFNREPMRSYAYPRRGCALRDFFMLPRGCKSDVLDRRDILPAMADVVDSCLSIYSRFRRERQESAPRGQTAQLNV